MNKFTIEEIHAGVGMLDSFGRVVSAIEKEFYISTRYDISPEKVFGSDNANTFNEAVEKGELIAGNISHWFENNKTIQQEVVNIPDVMIPSPGSPRLLPQEGLKPLATSGVLYRHKTNNATFYVCPITEWQNTITAYILPSQYAEAKKALEEFIHTHIDAEKIRKRAQSRMVGIISWDGQCYRLQHYDIKPFTTSLEENYNDDIQKVYHDEIAPFITSPGAGIILLHGEPGTGKTTFLRYLINKYEENFVYIPNTLMNNITDPTFIQFALNMSGAIFIIEDGEKIFAKRMDTHGNEATNDFLNLADGILGDLMSFKIIGTFNCKIGDIDEAFLRPGRCKSIYEFKKLNEEKAKKLAEKLRVSKEIKGSATLADLYNNELLQSNSNKSKLGFSQE